VTLFGTLTIGKQGLTAQQRAISVTSNNVANVNTPGYTRQRPVFEPVSPAYTGTGVPLGGGVEVIDAERVADAFLEAQLDRERYQLGLHQGLDAGLSRVEAIFDEVSGRGIGATLSAFFGALNDLAAHPHDPTVRASAVSTAQTLVDQIRDADRRLEQIQVDANQQIAQLADDVSQIARDIAELNRQIFSKEAGSPATASALRDQRAALLTQLAGKIDFTAVERDDGTTSVYVAGGFFLVDGDQAARLTVEAGAGANGNFFHVWQDLDGAVQGPITSRITGGALGAQLALRDDRIVDYRGRLDEFAFTLARRINTVHLAGAGLVDDVARRLFVDRTAAASAAGTDLSSVSGAAAALGIHAAIAADARHLAAGLPPGGGAPAAAGDNRSALALAAVEAAASATFQVGDPAAGPPTGSARTIGAAWDATLGALGTEIQAQRRLADQTDLMVAELEGRRAALSGVSLDEEVANLVRFERAYQANARVLDTANQLLEMLLSV
jgi:flagellar hook-associated protein 1 FlgK